MDPFTELSIFSGAGGGLLGTTHLLGWRTVCYVEWDRYAVEVLKARIRDGYLHDAPIWDDAFTFDGRPWAGLVDVVTAGFPCQPFSVAGKGLSENDPRNGWPATIRIIREVRPLIAKLENVPGLLSKRYFGVILADLAQAGYRIEWDCISAQEVGANHKRERLWIVAHAEGGERHLSEELKRQALLHLDGDGGTRPMADTDIFRLKGLPGTTQWQRGRENELSSRSEEISDPNIERLSITKQKWKLRRSTPEFHSEVSHPTGRELGKFGEPSTTAKTGGRRSDNPGRETQDVRGEWWEVEPELGRVADGVANRVERLRAIGNGQVPAVVREAWNRLSGGRR